MSTIASHSPSRKPLRDKALVPKDNEQEMAYGESNGHIMLFSKNCEILGSLL